MGMFKVPIFSEQKGPPHYSSFSSHPLSLVKRPQILFFQELPATLLVLVHCFMPVELTSLLIQLLLLEIVAESLSLSAQSWFFLVWAWKGSFRI